MAKSVKIYSSPGCSYCIRAKQFLKDNSIPFIDYDVSRDPAKGQEMIARSGQMGVPVIDIDGELIVGFDRARIEELLGLNAE